MADVIGVITAQKNTKLEGMHWLYPDEEEGDLLLMEKALGIAQRKANRIASTMKVRLLGVSSVFTEYTDSEQEYRSFQRNEKGGNQSLYFGASPPRSRQVQRLVTAEELGLAITHRKMVQIGVSVAYRISGFSEKVG